MKILLIAGHGAGDPGACALGYRESDLAREVVTGVAKALEGYADVDIFDTSKDMYQYLKNGNTFNFKAYNYVLEMHFNSAVKDLTGNGLTTGAEVLAVSVETQKAAPLAILHNLELLGFKNRGIKSRDDLRVIKTCKMLQGVSCALLELCFIDDADDMALYKSKKQQVINAIAKGLTHSFGLVKAPILLGSANDITWELNSSHFPINDTPRFVAALNEAKKANSPLYWGYYKLVNHIDTVPVAHNPSGKA